MNLPRWTAALLLFALVPAPGRSCAAGQCPWMPGMPGTGGRTACHGIASPVPDCCRVQAAGEGAPAVARLVEPAPPLLAAEPEIFTLRPPAPCRRVPAARPLGCGPPLYTLLAVLLI